MIRYLPADSLDRHPVLAREMFRDRAAQFRDRLRWEVTVDDRGEERDEYDGKDPLYVIWETEAGGHGGSMRFLPTTGDTMINDHFLHLTDGVEIRSPFIWECTRFCLAPGAGRRVSAALMLAGLDLGLGQGLSHAVGVFDAPMERVYRALGWAPDILGERDGVAVGLWAFEAERREILLRRAGLEAETADRWYRDAFGTVPCRDSMAA